MNNLKNTLDALLVECGAEVAVAMQTLDEKDSLYINANTVYHAASTMKVAVMLELFHQLEQGKTRLTDTLPILRDFPSIMDGSLFRQAQEYDTETELYAAFEMSIYDLCLLMITISSNLATNILMRHVGRENIAATLKAKGIEDMTIIRYLEDNLAFERGINNDTDAQSLLKLFMGIGQKRILSAQSCDAMLDILKQQKVVNRIPVGLPAGTIVAHKTGEISRHMHDSGIVYGPRPFALVVLTRGVEEPERSASLIASIAKAVYEAVN